MTFLVIGCGSIGRRHLANLQRLGQRDVVVFDTDARRRAEVSAHWQVPGVEDVASAFARRPDGVLVCTPSSSHLAYALTAVRAGAHVFIEKPLAHTLDGVEALLEEAARRQRHLLVGCNFRFEPGLCRLKAMVGSGAIGQVLGARAVFGHYLPAWHPGEDYRRGYSAQQALGGGIILDAVHEVDYLQWLLGEVRAVACFSGKVSDLEIDVEDHAGMLLRFASGVTAEVHVDYLQRAYQRSVEVYGSAGTLMWSFQDRQVRWFSSATNAWETFPVNGDAAEHWNQMYLEELRHFLTCCAGKATPMLDGAGGRRVLEVALAAKTAAATMRVVELS